MTKRIIAHVIDECGIVASADIAVRTAKHLNGFRRWIAMDQGATIEQLIARRKELGVDGFGVLLDIILHTQPGNQLPFVQVDIAKRLGMYPTNVSRAVKRLVSAGVLQVCGKLGVNKIYRLHPEFAWMGSAKSHKLELRRLRDGRKMETSDN